MAKGSGRPRGAGGIVLLLGLVAAVAGVWRWRAWEPEREGAPAGPEATRPEAGDREGTPAAATGDRAPDGPHRKDRPGRERSARRAGRTAGDRGEGARPAAPGSASPGAGRPAPTTPGGGPPPPPHPGDAGRRPPGSGGTLEPEAIREAVSGAKEHFRFCYDWQLELAPELGGRIVLAFDILPDGTVGPDVAVEDGLGDGVVARCAASVVRRLSFPPPEGGSTVRVRYPLRLTPGEPQSPE